MIQHSWSRTVRELSERTELARSAASRVESARDRPPGDHAQDERDSREQLFSTVALSRARDAALLKAARFALRRRAAGRPAPLWLPHGRVLPGAATPRRWRSAAVFRDDAGIWRVIPQPGPERLVGLPEDDTLVLEVAEQARLLRASLLGHQNRDAYYEVFKPDGRRGQGTSVPPIAVLSSKTSWKVQTWLHPGLGMRVQADLEEEFQQANLDRHAVWERSRAYSAAVVKLLGRVG
ncbi:hypothetical protein ACFVX9_03745 [Kitasatospora sp. NPDC058243]|uniref:hypothetical protein n=1 Tax=Kitasatospora sp. NPDC058243 TaxID=3346397 RepID=UPI0036DDFBF1